MTVLDDMVIQAPAENDEDDLCHTGCTECYAILCNGEIAVEVVVEGEWCNGDCGDEPCRICEIIAREPICPWCGKE